MNDSHDPNDPNNTDIPNDANTHDIDLSEFDAVYAEAPEEGNDADTVPDGKYQVSVEKVELGWTKSSGQRILKWSLRILGPRFAGRMLWHNNMIATDENIRWLKRDLVTCGLKLPKFQDLPAHLDELLDIQLDVNKRTKGDYTNIRLIRRIANPDQGAGHGGADPNGASF